MGNFGEYHGIVINISQKKSAVLDHLDIIGRKKVLSNALVLLKLRVAADAIEPTILRLQANMRRSLPPVIRAFYFHFYNESELIVVFKDRIFRTRPDPVLWDEVIEYGKSLGIPEKQLDFFPCRIADEEY
jgi:hypothetical protein